MSGHFIVAAHPANDAPPVNAMGPYDLRDAMRVCREENESHPGWHFHIYRLQRVPRFVEAADLRAADEHAFVGLFDRYLSSSEALGQDR